MKKIKPNNELLEITNHELYLDCCADSITTLCNFHNYGRLDRKWRAENENGLIYYIKYNVLLLSVSMGETEYEAANNHNVLAVSSQKQSVDSNTLISFFAWKVPLDNVW